MPLKKVGGLWLATKDGKQFMKGTLTESVSAGAKVFVYRNTYKKEDKHPDYTLHVAVDEHNQEPRRHEQSQPEDDRPPF